MKTCDVCGEEFHQCQRTQLYCSARCRDRHKYLKHADALRANSRIRSRENYLKNRDLILKKRRLRRKSKRQQTMRIHPQKTAEQIRERNAANSRRRYPHRREILLLRSRLYYAKHADEIIEQKRLSRMKAHERTALLKLAALAAQLQELTP